MMSESKIQRAIRIALNRTMRVRVVRNNVGSVTTADGRFISFGVGRGSADLLGVLRSGRAVGFELKAATGRVSDDQRRWHEAARKWGVFVAVVRSVDEALEALARAEQGACE